MMRLMRLSPLVLLPVLSLAASAGKPDAQSGRVLGPKHSLRFASTSAKSKAKAQAYYKVVNTDQLEVTVKPGVSKTLRDILRNTPYESGQFSRQPEDFKLWVALETATSSEFPVKISDRTGWVEGSEGTDCQSSFAEFASGQPIDLHDRYLAVLWYKKLDQMVKHRLMLQKLMKKGPRLTEAELRAKIQKQWRCVDKLKAQYETWKRTKNHGRKYGEGMPASTDPGLRRQAAELRELKRAIWCRQPLRPPPEDVKGGLHNQGGNNKFVYGGRFDGSVANRWEFYICDPMRCQSFKGGDNGFGTVQGQGYNGPNHCCAPDMGTKYGDDPNVCHRPRCVKWEQLDNGMGWKAVNQCSSDEICVVYRHSADFDAGSWSDRDSTGKGQGRGGIGRHVCVKKMPENLLQDPQISEKGGDSKLQTCPLAKSCKTCDAGNNMLQGLQSPTRPDHRMMLTKCKNRNLYKDDVLNTEGEGGTGREGGSHWTIAGVCAPVCQARPNTPWLEACYKTIPGQIDNDYGTGCTSTCNQQQWDAAGTGSNWGERLRSCCYKSGPAVKHRCMARGASINWPGFL